MEWAGLGSRPGACAEGAHVGRPAVGSKAGAARAGLRGRRELEGGGRPLRLRGPLLPPPRAVPAAALPFR